LGRNAEDEDFNAYLECTNWVETIEELLSEKKFSLVMFLGKLRAVLNLKA
jgi:hypothetical protein